ncbi:MAG: aldo/keto reductase [Hyphomicrobiaceae bacterium]
MSSPLLPTTIFKTRAGVEIKFSHLGLGTAPLGNIFAPIPEAVAEATIEAAWNAGIRYFDTAPLYGRGIAETRLNRTLRPKPRESYTLSTKVGRIMKRTTPDKMVGHTKYFGTPAREVVYDYSYDGIMRSVEHSLERLGVDRFDALYIHDIDPVTHESVEVSEAHMRTLFGSGLKALDELKRTGVTRAIGTGLNVIETTERLVRDADLDLVLLAGRYSLLEQGTLASLFPLCQKKGVGVIAAGVFNSGLLAGGSTYNYAAAPAELVKRRDAIAAICTKHSVALAHAALQFPAFHPAVTTTIFGAVTPAEVKANVAAKAQPIPADLWRDLKSAGLLALDAPTPI